MTRTFIDTSFLFAIVLQHDAWHSAAAKWRGRLTMPLLTTEYVLVEFVDGLSRERYRSVAVQTLRAMQRRQTLTVVPASPQLLSEGVALFEQRIDKAWSLTDCISFVVMQRHDSTEALTHDHHFEQAGFVALLRRDP